MKKRTRQPCPTNSSNLTVLPCNFRSAGRLSNESVRTLTALHEGMARNLTNSLDVYLGTGLEVRFHSLEQLTMEEYKVKCAVGGYMLPCTTRGTSSTVMLELDNPLMFTVIDLLLGGVGTTLDTTRELTEIDEEIMEGVASLIAQEIERAWQPVGYAVIPGKCVKPNAAHRVFPLTEKVLRIQFDMSVAGMTGSLFVAFPASLGSNLVRSIRADISSVTSGSGFEIVPSLAKRMLDCKFQLSGELSNLKVPVRHLASIQVGSVLMLSAPIAGPGILTLEGRSYFEALPVRQLNNKAMQLAGRLQARPANLEEDEDKNDANS